MIEVGGADVVELHEAADGGELVAQEFAGGQAAGVVHEAGAHGADDFEFAATSGVGDGEDAVATHEGESCFGGHGIGLNAVVEVVTGFLEDPGIGHGGAADHDAANAGLGATDFDVGSGGDVAIADDRDGDGVGDLADDVPVGEAGVALGAGSAVDGDGGHAAVLKAGGDFEGVDLGGVPADADFGGDGDASGADGVGDTAGDAFEEGAVAEEGGATVFGDDFVDGAAEVDVDEVGLFAVDDFAGGFAHAFAIGAEELDADGALGLIKLGVVAGAFVGLEDAFGGDEFGDHDIGAEFFAEATKDLVRHACHGGEVEREGVVVEPGEHGGPSLQQDQGRGKGERGSGEWLTRRH